MRRTLAGGIAGVAAASAAAVLLTGGAAWAQPDQRTAAQQVVQTPPAVDIDPDEFPTDFDELWEWSGPAAEAGLTVDTTRHFVIDPETLTPDELEAIEKLPTYED
jgi:hypothetical protein